MFALLSSGRRAKLDARLEEMKGVDPNATSAPVRQIAKAALPKIGSHLVPSDEKEQKRLQARLVQAGLYSRQAMVIFLGVKMLLMVGPALIGLGLGLANFIPLKAGVLYGACIGTIGMIGPSFWLNRKKSKRQMLFRRG
jgi:hypothetical protein